MIEANGLTKRYGTKTAVHNLNFALEPGKVTGFLGPNGAGKSTTMRMILGLDRPTAGRVTVCGRPFAQHDSPLTVAGALLEAKGVHPGRTAYSHLRSIADTHGLPARRVDEVLELTGLSEVSKKRIGGFSLGMGQRLGIAVALLGDPQVLLLDEPVNGLDPDGIVWVRKLVRHYASLGRTVLLSSHLMSEMAQVADHLLVIGKGRLLANSSMQELIAGTHTTEVRVVSPQALTLAEVLTRQGVSCQHVGHEQLTISGISAAQVGDVAFKERIVLHGLQENSATLEDAYMNLTRGEVEYEAAN